MASRGAGPPVPVEPTPTLGTAGSSLFPPPRLSSSSSSSPSPKLPAESCRRREAGWLRVKEGMSAALTEAKIWRLAGMFAGRGGGMAAVGGGGGVRGGKRFGCTSARGLTSQ